MATAELTTDRASIVARIRTWWIILRINLDERLAYRGDFMLGTLMRFLPMITLIFLWSAVFQGNGGGGTQIAGYTFEEFIAYFLLATIGRAFSSMPGLGSSIARSIRDGTIKKFLIQPVDMIGFLLLGRVAHKLVYYLVSTLPFALVFFLCRGYFNGWPQPEVMLAFVISLALSFLLGFYLETAIGLIGFWFLEVSSLMFVYMLFTFALSGQMFPLDMLDSVTIAGNVSAGDVIRATPLQYLAYFPARIFLGKISGAALWWGVAGEAAWVVALATLCRVAFNRGLRRYSAFGG